MVFAIGTKVKLIHTGDVGVVTAWLDDGMINVRLIGDDMEIPAFPEDIARLDEETSSVKAKIIRGAAEKPAPTPPHRPRPEIQYSILKSQGIQLAFEPMFREDGTAEKFIIYLINDTRYDVLYDYEFSLMTGFKLSGNGKLAALTYYRIGEMVYDQLNESPVFDIDCQQITTEGIGSKYHKNLKIKAKQFFSKIKTAPLLNRQAHLFRLFEHFQQEDSKKDEDLKTYTQRNTRPSWHFKEEDNPHEVAEKAHFESEIDLHVEKLAPEGHKKLSNAEILNLQLTHFDRFIDQAIKLGVNRVFVIHGVGEGRLRDALATRLMQMQAVKTFKNEYHPRYGYGATEVIFEL